MDWFRAAHAFGAVAFLDDGDRGEFLFAGRVMLERFGSGMLCRLN